VTDTSVEQDQDGPRTLVVSECPVCHNSRFNPARVNGLRLQSCSICGLVVQSPQPDDRELRAIYGADYFIESLDDPEILNHFEQVKRATARLQLDEIAAYSRGRATAPDNPSLIEIGCGHGNFLVEARAKGFDVHGLEFSIDAAAAANAKLQGRVEVGSIEDGTLPAGRFDVCVVADVIEHVREPRRFLEQVGRVLKAGGVIFIATPSLDSWSARLLGSHWMEYKREHLYYFNRATLKRLLSDAGFSNIKVSTGAKVLTPGYIIGHFKKFPIPLISPIMAGVEKLTPAAFLRSQWTLTASGINVLAARA